jgi:glycosyltransferase involved in cell wall biosynthesis
VFVTRLLIATTYPLTIQTFLLPYASHFRRLGWEVDAMACGDMEQIRDAFNAVHAVEWSRKLSDPRTLLAAPRAVRRLVERKRYDIVHVHTPVASFATRFALRGLRAAGSVKVVYTAHGFHFSATANPAKNIPFLMAEKLAGRWTDRLVVMNRDDEAAARRYRIVPEASLRWMPGIGVDLSVYSKRPSTEELRIVLREVGLEEGEEYILNIAEFREVKRHRDLLTAFAEIAREPEFARVRLLLAGNGPLLEQMKSRAQELGVASRVKFLGFRPDVPVLLAGARAVLLPSAQEGLPRCILEAMIAGVPVIATDVRGNSDLLEGDCGLLVPLGAPRALADAIRVVVRDRHAAEARARLASARIEQFEIRKLLAMHEGLYDEVLSGEPFGGFALDA